MDGDVRKLTPSEWLALIPIFRRDFDSDMPSPEHGDIYGIFEDGKCVAFILIENVKVVGQIWTRPDKKGGNLVRKIVSFVRQHIPAKQSVAALASEPRFEMLYRSMGMEKIDGTLFRRNQR